MICPICLKYCNWIFLYEKCCSCRKTDEPCEKCLKQYNNIPLTIEEMN